MKRLLLSFVILSITSILAIGATSSYFSDIEVSSTNTFTAGTLNLSIDGSDGSSFTTKYILTDWKPGTQKNVGTFTLKNTGSLPGKYWIEITNIVNYENSCNEVEINSGDITCNSTQGELGSLISGSFKEDSTPLYPLISTFNSIQTIHMIAQDGGTLNPNEEVSVSLNTSWIASSKDNTAQGDSITFDIVFHLEQL